MAYIEPNTTVKFLDDIPLDPAYENTLYFDTPQDQFAYFSSRSFLSLDNNSYQRKNKGVIRCGWEADKYGHSVIEELYNCHYMMFNNTNFENKWFYAFVDTVVYVNNNTVDVYYSIDIMQTWHFDYVFNHCMIDRQHVSNDNVGANTVPEQLECGPYIGDRPPYRTLLGDTIYGGDFEYTPGIIVATTFNSEFQYEAGRVIRGNDPRGRYFSGIWFKTFSLSTQDIQDLNDFLEQASTQQAYRDGIISLAMIPLSLVDPEGEDYSYNDILFTRPNSLGSYTPRNKKLLTNPYNFLYVTNNNGQSAEYFWEDSFNVGYLEFRVWANYSANPSMIGAPVQYKCADNIANYDEKIVVDSFPLCAWTNDAYKAWLAQNAGTIAGVGLNILMGWARGIGKGYETYLLSQEPLVNNDYHGQYQKVLNSAQDTLTEITRAAGATAIALGQLYDHSRKPPQSNGNYNGNVTFQAGLATFSFYRKYIKPEYASIIDKYFDMYGYAIHSVGIPNRNVRRCYTYTKTIGCSLQGNVPSDDLRAIEKIFDNGIRFWRSTATFGSYDPAVNNNTV